MPKSETILTFHQGTLLLNNCGPEVEPPYFLWDTRSKQWRAKAVYYSEILKWLQSQGVGVEDQASAISTPELKLRMRVTLRPYQKEAIDTWLMGEKQGTVCLPTGPCFSPISRLVADFLRSARSSRQILVSEPSSCSSRTPIA